MFILIGEYELQYIDDAHHIYTIIVSEMMVMQRNNCVLFIEKERNTNDKLIAYLYEYCGMHAENKGVYSRTNGIKITIDK